MTVNKITMAVMAEDSAPETAVPDDETVVVADYTRTAAHEWAWSAEQVEDYPEPRRMLRRWVWAVASGIVSAVVLLVLAADTTPSAITSTSTVTVAAPTSALSPPRARTPEEADALFLDKLRHAGLVITDPAVAAAGGRNGCRYLADGHSFAELVDLVRSNNPAFTSGDARAIAAALIAAYCP